MIRYADIKCVQDDPVLNRIVKCSDKKLPELAVLANRTYPGDSFKFWRRQRRIDTDIFVKHCEGVCAAKPKYDVERRDLRFFRRKIEWCQGAEDAVNNGVPNAVDIPAETMMEEMANIQRRLVQGLYTKEGPNAPMTLREMACLRFDASKKAWNSIKDFDGTEEGFAEGVTSAYLIFNDSGSGFHWAWGNGRMINIGPVRDRDAVDSDKDCPCGDEATYPIYRRYVDGTVSPVVFCQEDVIEICDIPCGIADGFYLDNVIGNILDKLGSTLTNMPNVLIVDRRAVRNWWVSRREKGLENGGCCFVNIPNTDTRFPTLDSEQVVIVRSNCIPQEDYKDIEQIDPKDSLLDPDNKAAAAAAAAAAPAAAKKKATAKKEAA